VRPISSSIVVGDIAGGGAGCDLFGGLALGGAVLGLLALDDRYAHLGERGHGVFDLLRRHLIGRQNLVQFVIGDIAALLGAGDHLLDRGHGAVH
jgi:hypothetical protein